MADKAHDISTRKAQHLDICVEADSYRVESGSTRLDEVRFLHAAAPEVNVDAIDTSMDFLGQRVSLPFFISSMTGGSARGYEANKQLAMAAQQERIAVGMGSIRILFRKPEVFEHFYLRKLAPDVPIFANLGGVQIRDMQHSDIHTVLQRLEVSALAIHLNPGQELFQTGGDRDFRGVIDAIRRFCEHSPVPVIVKETGFGIDPATAAALIDSGVRYVNIAGAGGTNWITVESYREDPAMFAAAEEFRDWGMPTGLLLAAAREQQHLQGRILASGGLRSGLDIAKAVALGAEAAGFALPFIRAVHAEGTEGACKVIRQVRRVFLAAMALTGASSLQEFRRGPVWLSDRLTADTSRFSAGAAEWNTRLSE
ncbi:type 2 isopentenyl-diphosphate Delta-isomerase [Spirochaeta africana]|uniref:Isopentenyl-diphosphate delta-isomerase n=1 Tax=Spirochaeta africana (strain ATCC 700263 / DSM 8902 / Z-7692) TaxID=889378 RepID=H9UG38_SPIAZ|nr:type 2 isopentenyl-diphosphate Delta-isomerase [Spirochaeta africana]AFG36481.1 isopentenyl-diphosphate delta-isomerase, type 2 [Spirochaeta africana DSM 8902]